MKKNIAIILAIAVLILVAFALSLKVARQPAAETGAPAAIRPEAAPPSPLPNEDNAPESPNDNLDQALQDLESLGQ